MILLDTHVVLWLSHDSARLSAAATEAIHAARRSGGLAISAVTLFEVAYLGVRRRITVLPSLDLYLNALTEHVLVKDITVPVAIASARFTDPYPKDPIDRVIGATALVEDIPLVTADERIRDSGQLQTIW